jgi:hypothetical protein
MAMEMGTLQYSQVISEPAADAKASEKQKKMIRLMTLSSTLYGTIRKFVDREV